MNIYFDATAAQNYKSRTQKIRIMSESWVSRNAYCPCCGHNNLEKERNNMPAADFICPSCNEIFELKSKQGTIGKKIVNGAYETTIERITSESNPDLMALTYSKELKVTSLAVIPKFLFTPSVIEKRKPLSEKARRAGWTGCNILFGKIPAQGKIYLIENETPAPRKQVIDMYSRCRALYTRDIEARGWLLDILNCVNEIEGDEFTLAEMYSFKNRLQIIHPLNRNIEAKIRQQLQILRDKNFIAFMGGGKYKKIFKK